MASINVLISTFAGLNLPPTLCLSLPEKSTVYNLHHLVASLIPPQAAQHAFLTTAQGHALSCRDENLKALVDSHEHNAQPFLSLRLNAPLRGGKGGFGSQLRAAGGRMSSKKRKQMTEQATGSARNLDGRRLRTITEAKNLATYLATKPDMDRKEKEERRKRWEAVVQLAEQREADMKAGKTIDGRRKGLSSEWLEEKDEVGENVKNAVNAAMAASTADADAEQATSSGSGGSAHESADEDSDADDPMELDETDMNRLRIEAENGDADALWVLQNKLKIPKDLLPKTKPKTPRFAGFDDELSDSDSDEADEQYVDDPDDAKGKTKAEKVSTES